MTPTSYRLDLPDNPSAVTFVNGIKAETLAGCLWLWKLILFTKRFSLATEGCKQVKLGICSYREGIIVSYWQDEASLMKFFHSEAHRQMMTEMSEFISSHPQAISVYNETYCPLRSGKYFQKPHGLAKMYRHVE